MEPLDPDVCKPLRVLPDGRGVFIYPLVLGGARIGVGPVDRPCFDDLW